MLIEQLQIDNHFTFQEKNLAHYILSYPENVLKMNIRELGKASYTSTATILRLCKKLNFKGYSEFKIAYALEHPKVSRSIKLLNTNLDLMSTQNILDSLYLTYLVQLNNLREQINISVLYEVINKTKTSKKINIYSNTLRKDMFENFIYKAKTLDISLNLFQNEYYRDFISYKVFNLFITKTDKKKIVIEVIKHITKDNVYIKIPLLTIDSCHYQNTELAILYLLDLIIMIYKK